MRIKKGEPAQVRENAADKELVPFMTFPRSILFLALLLSAAVISAWAQADETIYSKVDENPVPLKTPPPRYPDAMKREGISGLVAIAVVIDEKGNIISSVVTKSSHSDFDKPALDAVKSWKFKPAKIDGTPVKVRVTVPLRFSLGEA